MKKFFLPIFFCIFALTFVYASNLQEDMSENLLRMHIVANSNSEFDQNVKLFVRDEILKNIDNSPDIPTIEKYASQALSKTDAGYSLEVFKNRRYVPKKEYKNIRLPEGIYDCINVILGDGKGENWWCVAYPPLCFTEDVFGEMSEDAKKLLSNTLDKETLDTIIKSGGINFKFKLVEFIQKIRFS